MSVWFLSFFFILESLQVVPELASSLDGSVPVSDFNFTYHPRGVVCLILLNPAMAFIGIGATWLLTSLLSPPLLTESVILTHVCADGGLRYYYYLSFFFVNVGPGDVARQNMI